MSSVQYVMGILSEEEATTSHLRHLAKTSMAVDVLAFSKEHGEEEAEPPPHSYLLDRDRRGRVASYPDTSMFSLFLFLLPHHFFPRCSQVATKLIPPDGRQQRSKSIVIDQFRAVTGRKQPRFSFVTGLDKWYRPVEGGSRIVNSCGTSSGNMRRNIGLELLGAIDSRLKWKTTTKDRKRAVRRARTSYSGGFRKNSAVKSSKRNEDTKDQYLKRARDFSVSESEKVGVSVLGGRFSDSLEIVPIKKRRFLLVSSPSSPLQSSYSDDSDHLIEVQPPSYQKPSAYDKNHVKKAVANWTSNLHDINEEASAAADFSGISILAAAACDSEILSDIINTGGSVSKGHYCEVLFKDTQGAKSHSLYGDKERQPQSTQDLHENCDVFMEKCSTSISAIDEKYQGSANEKSLVDPLQNASDKMRSSGSDSRLHWDLNTVMDTWNSKYDVVISESEPHPINPACENHNHNKKLEEFEALQHQVENCESTCYTEFGESGENVAGLSKDNRALLKSEAWEKPDVCNDSSVVDHEKVKQWSLPHSDGLVEELEDATSISLVNSSGETKVVSNQANEICGTKVVSSVVGDVLASLRDTTMVIESVKAKADTDSGLELETATSFSHLPLSLDVSSDFNTHPYNSHLKFGQSISKPIFDEKPNAVAFNTDHCLANAEVEHPSHINSSQFEKQGLLNTDSESSYHCPPQAEKTSDPSFHKSTSHEIEHSDDIDVTNDLHADGSPGTVDRCSCLLNGRQQGSLELCNPDALPSGITCVDKREQATAQLNVDDDKCVNPVVPVSVLAGMTEDVNLVDDAVGTQEPGKSYMVSCVNYSGEVALNDCIHNYGSGASLADLGEASGVEKVDLLGDDDSQFEDGEFRESVLQSWGDGAEEGESEHLDYGSDNKENVAFEAVSGFPYSVSFSSESMTCKNRDALVAAHDGATPVMNSVFAVSEPPLKCSSKSTSLDAGDGKRSFVDVDRKDCTDHFVVNNWRRKQRSGSNSSVPGSHGENMIGHSGLQEKGDNDREPSASVRIKASGWDKLPIDHVHTGDTMLDAGIGSVKQGGKAGALDIFDTDKLLERSCLLFRRGLSSQVERLMSSDESYRRDRSCVKGCRSDSNGGLNTKAEKNSAAPKSADMGESSQHTKGRCRDEHWFDSPSYCGPKHHDSPEYCDAPNYARPSLRNAAAAAVAKVESNGFVVAPDGTIVKAGGVGNAGPMLRRAANASLQNRWRSQTETELAYGMQRRLGNVRNISPDRHFSSSRGRAGKYGHEMARYRYHRSVPDGIMDSSLTMHHLSSRDRSFSPHRGPLRLSRSRTRSPSRSRSRSPHMWTSPRRREIGMSDTHGFRKRNRTPKIRMERMRSPQSRPSSEDFMVRYGPTSKTHASPLHSSRWIDERRDSHNHHRKHEYKRSSRRSPSIKVFRNPRLDSMDSQGRSKPDNYCRPLHSSKIPEVAVFNKRYRCAGSDDRRGYDDRYDSLQPMRRYNPDNNEKRFR
ncbi:hypothetical protein B296_00009724 [Ensete ventricosum]|uniref:Uncharacterized protein n=1 Tax=Ensete ventricosum TaxID=4639 RepID=A0A427BAQ7_ENSVE|nr:hypothetical protein B296_00009724 [Ensete ventricosum]